MESVGTVDDERRTVTVDEVQLLAALRGDGAHGSNPESDTQIVNRVNTVERFCLDEESLDACLREVSGKDNDGQQPDDGPVVEALPLEAGPDRGGASVSTESLTADLPS